MSSRIESVTHHRQGHAATSSFFGKFVRFGSFSSFFFVCVFHTFFFAILKFLSAFFLVCVAADEGEKQLKKKINAKVFLSLCIWQIFLDSLHKKMLPRSTQLGYSNFIFFLYIYFLYENETQNILRSVAAKTSGIALSGGVGLLRMFF